MVQKTVMCPLGLQPVSHRRNKGIESNKYVIFLSVQPLQPQLPTFLRLFQIARQSPNTPGLHTEPGELYNGNCIFIIQSSCRVSPLLFSLCPSVLSRVMCKAISKKKRTAKTKNTNNRNKKQTINNSNNKTTQTNKQTRKQTTTKNPTYCLLLQICIKYVSEMFLLVSLSARQNACFSANHCLNCQFCSPFY